MKRHPEIKWSEVARQAMWEYARKLELLDRVADARRKTRHHDNILGSALSCRACIGAVVLRADPGILWR